LQRNVAIQGEIIGPKVSGNRLKLPELTFRVFSIFDIDLQLYLAHDEVMELCHQLELEHVPILFQGIVTPELEMFQSVDALLSYAESVEYAPNKPAEGIVVKVNKRFNRMLLDHDIVSLNNQLAQSTTENIATEMVTVDSPMTTMETDTSNADTAVTTTMTATPWKISFKTISNRYLLKNNL
jgi:hypothetical protein